MYVPLQHFGAFSDQNCAALSDLCIPMYTYVYACVPISCAHMCKCARVYADLKM